MTSTGSGGAAIEVRGLRKSYGTTEALRGIDLTVSHGEVFALLGPNGAGKTTAVEILEGHRNRDGGEVSVLGHDPWRHERALLQRIGIVLQETGVEPYLRVEETVELFRGYYPHPRPLDEVLEVVGLSEQRATRVRRLSGGQQRRLDVAIGLCGDPDLLFLDEPTTGFDPSARRGAWEMIENLRSLGKTVLLTTHYMDEAARLCDRLVIIEHGKIVVEGSPAELVQRHVGRSVVEVVGGQGLDTLVHDNGWDAEHAGDRLLIYGADGESVYRQVMDAARPDECSLRMANLEDVFLRLTGHELRE